MEACGGARFWGREIGLLGHDVRLIPPAYVKPFVKRQKNDAADAEAICEAAVRPSIRFVPVKSEETQGAAMVFPVRELLIRQRTQAINALRGHLTEFGQIVPQGAANASKLISVVEGPDSGIPAEAIATRERQCKSLPRKWRDSLAAGRVKLCHFGSFWRQGGRGYFQRELYRKVRLARREGMSERAVALHFGISRASVKKITSFSIPPGYRRRAEIKRTITPLPWLTFALPFSPLVRTLRFLVGSVKRELRKGIEQVRQGREPQFCRDVATVGFCSCQGGSNLERNGSPGMPV